MPGGIHDFFQMHGFSRCARAVRQFRGRSDAQRARGRRRGRRGADGDGANCARHRACEGARGDRFTVSLVDDVTLPDGTILRAGYRGVGEVVKAEKNGMLGKTGKLGIRVNYLKVGDQRIRLRASKSMQGAHNTGAQVVTVVLVGVFAGFIKGHNTEIAKGASITAFADQDTELTAPLARPPQDL